MWEESATQRAERTGEEDEMREQRDATKDPADTVSTGSHVTVIGEVEVDWTSERGQRALDELWRLVRPDSRRARATRQP